MMYPSAEGRLATIEANSHNAAKDLTELKGTVEEMLRSFSEHREQVALRDYRINELTRKVDRLLEQNGVVNPWVNWGRIGAEVGVFISVVVLIFERFA